MTNHHYQLVAFDCDGVMFDTRQANRNYYNQILARLNKPPMSDEQFAYTHMHTVDEALVHLFQDEEQVRRAQRIRQRVNYIPFLQDMLIEPHLKTILQKLKPRYKTGVATNRTDTMNRVLHTHGLEGMFDLVVTALDVEHPKPHPDQLLALLGHFALKPGQMLYIGDSVVDEMAAAAAGVDLAAYDNRQLSARYHIQGLDELAFILDLEK